jgi:glucosamine--fructose-6-phosphate aminotransferase (isomerizing)
MSSSPVTRKVEAVDWDLGSVEKGGYDHYMLKEINEQPESIKNTYRGRLNFSEGTAILSGLNIGPKDIANIDRIQLFACGTSLNAAMLGKRFFEDLAQIPTDVTHAAEFRYSNPLVQRNTLAVALSQSGETADTLAAVREAMRKGADTYGVCNVVGSTIARETGQGVYLHAGPEISVASTKAFTSQVMVLLQMALKFGRCKRLSLDYGINLCKEIDTIPELVSEVLKQTDNIKSIAEKYTDCDNCFYIYHAAELKHGPIALLEEKVPVIALANDISGKEKIIGNIEECKARKSPVILTATVGDTECQSLSDDIIWIPKASAPIAAILTTVALQLFSYHVAVAKGCNVDQPRNLAKSVTVE